MSAHLRAGAVSRTEDASGAAGGCSQLLWSRLFCGPLKMRRVPQEPVLCTEYLFRTVEACFLHRMRRVPEEVVLCTEYLFCTVGACFEHRVPLKMRRVPQEAFLSTARIFRTREACFWYRVPSKEQVKGPPETSSALAGRRKWWKGPERTKRAGAVSRTEDASGGQEAAFGTPLKMRFRTAGGGFMHRGP